jgi:hypothetical protein
MTSNGDGVEAKAWKRFWVVFSNIVEIWSLWLFNLLRWLLTSSLGSKQILGLAIPRILNG